MAIKLHSVTFDGMRVITGLRLESFECDRPPANLRGWRVVLRGQALLMISPRGWTVGNPGARDPKGLCTVIEIPRSEVLLQWRGDETDADAITKGITKYESEPLGPAVEAPAVGSILAQVPPHQVGD